MGKKLMKYSLGLLIIALSIIVVVTLLRFTTPETLTVTAPNTMVSLPDQQPVRAESASRVSFLAVGDIMLSRHVAARMEQSKNPLLPFNQLVKLLESTDFNFGNLESPVSGNDRVKGRGLVFNTSTRYLDGLVSYKFKVLNLANNHALDQGLNGLENTRRVLSNNGIAYLGVGANKEEAWQPKIVAINDVRIGFVGASYASINDGGATQNKYIARIEDLNHLRDSLALLKTQADFNVVTMHAGVEYKRYPHSSQVAFAHAAIDSGADVVIGVHPHWIQTVELYQGKYIFYSLGNFVFDMSGHENTREGLALKIVLVKKLQSQASIQASGSVKLERIELIPVLIERCSPRQATEKESKRILQKIGLTANVITPETEAQSVRVR